MSAGFTNFDAALAIGLVMVLLLVFVNQFGGKHENRD